MEFSHLNITTILCFAHPILPPILAIAQSIEIQIKITLISYRRHVPPIYNQLTNSVYKKRAPLLYTLHKLWNTVSAYQISRNGQYCRRLSNKLGTKHFKTVLQPSASLALSLKENFIAGIILLFSKGDFSQMCETPDGNRQLAFHIACNPRPMPFGVLTAPWVEEEEMS